MVRVVLGVKLVLELGLRLGFKGQVRLRDRLGYC